MNEGAMRGEGITFCWNEGCEGMKVSEQGEGDGLEE